MRPLAVLLAGILTGPTGELPAWPDDVVHASSVAQELDGGHDVATDAGVAIWQQCVEPDAGDAAQELDGGAILLSPARARFDSCRLGAGAKCSELLEHVDAGEQGLTLKQHLWWLTSVVCALSAGFTAYANNRTARHLGLIP